MSERLPPQREPWMMFIPWQMKRRHAKAISLQRVLTCAHGQKEA